METYANKTGPDGCHAGKERKRSKAEHQPVWISYTLKIILIHFCNPDNFRFFKSRALGVSPRLILYAPTVPYTSINF